MNQLLATYTKINRENPEMGALVERSAQHFVWAKVHLAFSFQHFYMHFFYRYWLGYQRLFLNYLSVTFTHRNLCYPFLWNAPSREKIAYLTMWNCLSFALSRQSWFASCFARSFIFNICRRKGNGQLCRRVIKKTISSLYWNVRGRLTDSISEWRTHINAGFSFL